MAGEAIFVGYRRDDTADVAGRIYDAMALRFGKNRIFKDVDDIGPGVHFGDYIKTVIPRCRVALILIGPHWLESKDESGKRRIDDDHDWVRIEIETALATPGTLVVPVLVNGACMPRGDELPESIKPLLHRNAAIIRRDPDFHDDVERLASALRASVNTGILDLSKIGGQASSARSAPRARSPSRTPLMIAAALALLAAGYGAWRFLPAALAPSTAEQSVDGPSEADAAPGESDSAGSPTPADTDSRADIDEAPAPTANEPVEQRAPQRTLQTTGPREAAASADWIVGTWRLVEGGGDCLPLLWFAREGRDLVGRSDDDGEINMAVVTYSPNDGTWLGDGAVLRRNNDGTISGVSSNTSCTFARG